MERKLILRHSLIALAMGALAASAQADFLDGSSVGLTVPHLTQDFSGSTLDERDPVTNQFARVTFTRAFYYQDLLGDLPNMSGGRLGNFIANGDTQPGIFSAHFDQDLRAVAFSLNSQPGTGVFTAWLDGLMVATASASTHLDSLENYYGFTGLVFDEIRIDITSNQGNQIVDNVFALDNLQMVAAGVPTVPEPASVLLVLTGLALLGAVTRRRGA